MRSALRLCRNPVLAKDEQQVWTSAANRYRFHAKAIVSLGSAPCGHSRLALLGGFPDTVSMRVRACGVLLGCALALCACGGDDEESTSKTTKEPATLDLSKGPGCWDRAVKGTGEEGQEGAFIGGAVTAIGPTKDPVGSCERHWRQGVVRPGTTDPPPLRVCVGNNGTPWVVPARRANVCESLGLPDPNYTPPS